MKNFSISTVLGLTFGILLAGYAVFAYTPPTQAPPGENTPAPVNVGPDSQVKQGGLSIDSLLVGGGIKTGGFVSLPACDTTTEGTIVFNKNINKISICTGAAWEVFSTGIDFDNDGILAGADCNDGDGNVWQNLVGYPDNDSDGHFALSFENVCSGNNLPPSHSANEGDDCDDDCKDCFPGSTVTTASPDGLDQDCDGTNYNTTTETKSCTINDARLVSVSNLTTYCTTWCTANGGHTPVTVSCDNPVASSFNNSYYVSFTSCATGDFLGTATASWCQLLQLTCTCAEGYH